jgi:phosphohistidine swiveling domain-containing protein
MEIYKDSHLRPPRGAVIIISTLRFLYYTEWSKIFTGQWSLLLCSHMGYQHSKTIREELGFGMSKAIFVSKNGTATCYYDKEELANFGENLGKKVMNDTTLVMAWCETVRKLTDRINAIIKKEDVTLEDYQMFIELLYKYVTPYVAVKQIPNYLPEHLAKRFLPMLQESRIYSESVFVDIPRFMGRVAEGKEHDPHLVLCSFHSEFATHLDGDQLPSKEILQERFASCALINNDGECEVITGTAVDQLETSLIGKHNMTSVEGQTAYSGNVTGKVKVITDPRNAEIDPGDILVAGMTRPAYLPLMEKAAAIVTDAGGLLCHAAIVAREMKKPCVVGTQKATRVFKDGDIVDVDADNGIVKKR